MKKLLALLIITIIALAGSAFAQDYDSDSDNNDGTASVDQTITITIPERVALHITETTYTLDLNTPTAYAGLGGFDYTGEGCGFVRQNQIDQIAAGDPEVGPWAPFGVVGDYLTLESLFLANGGVSTYPAVILNGGNVENLGTTEDPDYSKGLLVCSNTKIVQKFSNSPSGFTFSVNVEVPAGVGQFGIIDRVMPFDLPPTNDDGINDGFPERDYDHLLGAGSHGPLTLAESSSVNTNGWRDDLIRELFYFDGTETPGTHIITVTYTLASNL